MHVIRSIEDFLAQEQAAQAEAATRIPAWARGIKVGDYFVRTFNGASVAARNETLSYNLSWEAGEAGAPFTIWSEVLPRTEEDEEGNEVILPYDDCNYRFTRSYSTFLPHGELGDVHLSVIDRVVTKEEFEKAKKRKWRE